MMRALREEQSKMEGCDNETEEKKNDCDVIVNGNINCDDDNDERKDFITIVTEILSEDEFSIADKVNLRDLPRELTDIELIIKKLKL